MNKIPTVFISYSWDNEEEKEWVVKLANYLRKNNIDATLDVFETQEGTTNLNSMMVDKIRDSDYTIIILTDNYVKKANTNEGGVGFETSMLISYIQENLLKIIPIMTKWNLNKETPFYLKGVHYIDFSNMKEDNERFKELLHRIFKVALIEKEILGEKPNLRPRKIEDLSENKFNDMIPDFSEITDMDKDKFIQESFFAIKSGISKLLEVTGQKNSSFNFTTDDLNSRKTIFKMYLNGNQKNAVKIWLGNTFSFGTNSINLSYGFQVSDSDSSMNEMITCEVGSKKNLELKMNMNMFGNREANTVDQIVKEIWKNIMN